jgi:hypothetical protein
MPAIHSQCFQGSLLSSIKVLLKLLDHHVAGVSDDDP